jgi:hypothetical protein
MPTIVRQQNRVLLKDAGIFIISVRAFPKPGTNPLLRRVRPECARPTRPIAHSLSCSSVQFKWFLLEHQGSGRVATRVKGDLLFRASWPAGLLYVS